MAVLGVAICVVPVLLMFGVPLAFALQMCGFGARQETTSPRGAYEAEVIQHGCGATTTGDHYEVIISDNRVGVFGKDEHTKSGTQRPVSIGWESEDVLVVYSTPRVLINVRDESSDGVTVRREASEDVS